MEDIVLLLTLLIAGFSILLFAVSIISYSRLKVTKFLIIGLAFLGFFAKAILLLLEYVVQDQIALIIDLIIIILLYLAIVKK